MFTEEKEQEVKKIIGYYPEKRSALIPLLHFSQDELGYISEDVMVYLAKILDLTPAQVYEVATFYTMFNLKPVGRYLIQVCRNISCSLLGAESLIDYLKERLGIDVGETTPDGMFTLKTVECLASCGTAPVIQINNDYYENLDKKKVNDILERLSGSH
ncbi:MAG: NADH-quinone oxidoreductase subunit NuoE [Nitrospirota bacterium]